MKRRTVHTWATDGASVLHFNTTLPYSALDPDEWSTSYGFDPPLNYWNYDVVVGQRLAGDNPLWRQICADPNILAVYSIDDDLTNIDPRNEVPYSIYSPPHVVAGTIANIAAADLVTVPTPAFADRVSHWNDKIAILPICIPDWFPVAAIPKADRFTIGWSGSMFKRQDWDGIAWALRQVADARPEVRFHMIGADYTNGLLGDKLRFDGWQAIGDSYWKYDFHVGLAPLLDSPFNALKSRTKLVEYGACGIPTIASPVGEYVDWIDFGINGLFASDPGTWAEQMIDLVDHPQQVEALGMNAWRKASAATIGRNIHLWEAAWQR